MPSPQTLDEGQLANFLGGRPLPILQSWMLPSRKPCKSWGGLANRLAGFQPSASKVAAFWYICNLSPLRKGIKKAGIDWARSCFVSPSFQCSQAILLAIMRSWLRGVLWCNKISDVAHVSGKSQVMKVLMYYDIYVYIVIYPRSSKHLLFYNKPCRVYLSFSLASSYWISRRLVAVLFAPNIVRLALIPGERRRERMEWRAA